MVILVLRRELDLQVSIEEHLRESEGNNCLTERFCVVVIYVMSRFLRHNDKRLDKTTKTDFDLA